MTKEEKQLLVKDLCARLPYKVIVEIISYGQENLRPWFGELSCKDLECFMLDVAYKSMKPYLRPMSSMTKEEEEQFENLTYNEHEDFETTTGRRMILATDSDTGYGSEYFSEDISEVVDWLNKHHFDYRGLIEKGLALEASENMYNN